MNLGDAGRLCYIRGTMDRQTEAHSVPEEDVLDAFNPWVAEWFKSTHREPTEPQRQAWHPIQASRNVLIHAPTGSGKTLAAFMSALDTLFAKDRSDRRKGVRVLYISPLKALNYDIERNLKDPLRGISDVAERSGESIPEVRVEVRTGDTPPSARARMVRNPPEILITTPESLNLILTSVRAREILRTVETVIVDEIHTLCANKRGVHLALSLERLEKLSPNFQRIGLSATQRPLSEVARVLGGQRVACRSADPTRLKSTPRPVEIVDCPGSKELKIEVIGMPETEDATAPDSIWPRLIPEVLSDIDDHETTLIFTNSRRQAENAADRLNSAYIARESDEAPSAAVGSGERGSGVVDGPFMAHHGSISDDMRREIERDLKEGRLPALVGTSTLELGIDIGSIDFVVQVQSPKSVIQGLQRIGRSGHSVGATSKGKVYATHAEDLLESMVVAKGMLDGEVETMRSPRNSLDVLTQQIVASVAVEDWDVAELFRMFKGAYPYEDLNYSSFKGVVKLVSGHYPRELFSSLRARVHWDQVRNRLEALPGTRMLAVSNGGAIVDRGAFSVYLPDRKTRIGELDEEFVYESGVGDAFALGSQVWRMASIDDDRVVAEPAPGALPRMPFWRGDFPWRPFDLSKRVAKLRSELAKRLRNDWQEGYGPPEVIEWLRSEYPVDEAGSRQAVAYVRQQLEWGDAISSDVTIVVETYQDQIGDRRIVVHSPFGGRVNGPWSVALAREITEKTKVEPEVQVSDDGIMFRLAEADGPAPIEIVSEMTAAQVKERVLVGMIDSPLFGAVFRQNSARALLLPTPGRWRRTPFWQQRLRSKDLLSVARSFPDFPMVLESYRDALEDFMDMPSLEEVVGRIQSGEIDVVHVNSNIPSPVARALEFQFEAYWIYEWDMPKAERGLQALSVDRVALAELFRNPESAGLLRQEAIDDVASRAARNAGGMGARSLTELAQLLEELGDLANHEIEDRVAGEWQDWISDLSAQGRVKQLEFGSRGRSELRWVAATLYDEYSSALKEPPDYGSVRRLVARFLARSGPVPLAVLQSRYPISLDALHEALNEMAAGSEVASGYFSSSGEVEWLDLAMLARIQERTLSILRSEVEPVNPLRYQAQVLNLHGVGGGRGREMLADALEQLQGIAMTPENWVKSVLPTRIHGFRPANLDDMIAGGDFNWVFCPSDESTSAKVALIREGQGRAFLPSSTLDSIESAVPDLQDRLGDVFEFISTEGTCSTETIVAAHPHQSISEVAEAVRTLALRGLVTCSSWVAAMSIASADRQRAASPSREPKLAMRGLSAREARQQFGQQMRRNSSLLPQGAMWSTTRRFSLLGPSISDAELGASRARLLMGRHGVVSRRALELDGTSWDWRGIYEAMSLMELRGEARRGYFVHHLPGVQFGSPDFVEKMRAAIGDDGFSSEYSAVRLIDPAYVMDRALARSTDADESELLATDRSSGTVAVFENGTSILVAHGNGDRIATAEASNPRLLKALSALVELLSTGSASRRLVVREWNEEAVLRSPGAELLSASGFRRDYPYMAMELLGARPLVLNR